MPTSIKDVLTSIPGLKHYYPLNKAYGAKDAVGGVNGTVKGNVVFTDTHAVFDGKSYIDLGDSNDFSAVTTGGLTIVVFLTIDNWKGAGASEYVHWAGKGKAGAHEYTFRHYVDGGSGEAASRQGRTSFYAFNLAGGLGAGSYFQDAEDKVERVVTGTLNAQNVSMWRDGVQRDTDPLSGYSVKLANGGASLCLGTRDTSTGYLVGKLRNVAVYNRVLSALEIKKIYEARSLPVDGGSTTTPEPPAPPVQGGSVKVAGQSHDIDGVDVNRGADQLIQYTSKFGAGTKTNAYGLEAAVVDGKVTAVSAAGNMGIPPGGYVLSGHGEARDFLSLNARVGVTVVMAGEETTTPPPPPNPGAAYIATGLDDVVGKHNALVNKLADKGVLD
jgi:Concanavalin A-like lectin/glucanases superfamily